MNLVLGIGSRPAPRPVDESLEDLSTGLGYNHTSDSFNDTAAVAPSPVKSEAVVDDDDALSYFAKLAEE